MLEGLGKVITSLFEGLDIRRRWFAIVFLLITLMMIASGFEYLTGYNYYRSLEKKVALLKELQALNKDGIATNPELKQIYDVTLQEMRNRPVQPLAFPDVIFANSVNFWKGLTGALIPLIFLVVTLFKPNKTSTDANTISGAIMAAILFGGIAIFLPTFYNPLVNYIGYPIALMLLLYLFGRTRTRV